MILRQKQPNYLETKVEDRLLEYEKNRKYKLEENREKQFEANSPKSFVPNYPIKNMYSAKNVEYKNRTASE